VHPGDTLAALVSMPLNRPAASRTQASDPLTDVIVNCPAPGRSARRFAWPSTT
jgi:hypothetical protein